MNLFKLIEQAGDLSESWQNQNDGFSSDSEPYLSSLIRNCHSYKSAGSYFSERDAEGLDEHELALAS